MDKKELTAPQLADIEKVAKEPRFKEIYFEERSRFPNLTHAQVLQRTKQIWFQPAV
ncbi:MAG TPA: hypothetical protein VGE31_02345 [Candidatus Paceibacterota bacterium]